MTQLPSCEVSIFLFRVIDTSIRTDGLRGLVLSLTHNLENMVEMANRDSDRPNGPR